jgi:hypothetical protein
MAELADMLAFRFFLLGIDSSVSYGVSPPA